MNPIASIRHLDQLIPAVQVKGKAQSQNLLVKIRLLWDWASLVTGMERTVKTAIRLLSLDLGCLNCVTELISNASRRIILQSQNPLLQVHPMDHLIIQPYWPPRTSFQAIKQRVLLINTASINIHTLGHTLGQARSPQEEQLPPLNSSSTRLENGREQRRILASIRCLVRQPRPIIQDLSTTYVDS